MDPISALNLAASIWTLIDFSITTTSKCMEIYHSADGALAENMRLEEVTLDLGLLSQAVESSVPANSTGLVAGNNRALIELSQKCVETSNILRDTLNKLKVDGTDRKWKSLRKSFHSAWARKRIEYAAEATKSYRDALNTRMLMDVRLRQQACFPSLGNDLTAIQQSLRNNAGLQARRDITLEQYHREIMAKVASESEKTREELSRQ